MRFARAAALPLAVLLALAGCVAEEPPALDDVNASAIDDGMEPAVDTGEGPAMASDVGHMPHMHDYWAGKDRVVLFDDVIDPSQNGDPFQNLEPLFGDKEAKAGRMLWTFPDRAIVYEGTGQMEVMASWDDPRVTSLAMEYRTPATQEFSEPLALPLSEPVTIPITPDMTDMPHMKTSRWLLGFETSEAPGAALGPFHLRVEIVRLNDITKFPGHPELFGGLPEKVIEDLDHEHTETSYAMRVPQLVTDGGFQEKFVSPSELVPMETQSMRIELDILETSAAPGQVSEIRFFYHGADTTFLGHPAVLPFEGSLAEGRLIYQIPVTMEQTDTPYGKESQWLFFVEPATKFTGQDAEPTAGGMTDVSIKYHLKVIVYDHELEDYSAMEGEA